MDFYAILDQVIALLRQRQRVTYRALQRQFGIDDTYLEDLKAELIDAQRLAVDEEGKVLVWMGDPTPASPAASAPMEPAHQAPLIYTPSYLAEKILTSRSALEGERKQVTVLFADIKDSTELIRDLDPEDAQKLLDPAIHLMMEAVHRFEGTVNQVLGDGIMSIFGAPIAHEDHALRACYAALAMQTAMREYTEEVLRAHGIPLQIRVGLNSGEVVVRTIGNDLHMDYSAVGQTTNLAARMEQLAAPGSIQLSVATLRLVEGLVQVKALGPIPVKGVSEPVDVYELTRASSIKRRLQAAIARGLTKFVGRDTEIEVLKQALEQAGASHGQIVAAVGEAGVGKSRLVYEFIHSHRTQGWLVLESASVSYGKATSYFPVVDLLKRYVHIEDGDDARIIRAKVTGQILTLDETLQDTIPPLLALLDTLPEDSPFLQLDPPQRRQRTLDGLKHILLRESQVQPLVLVFEDLHWIDSETQALLDSLMERLPTAQLLLLVNYRPEYTHSWGDKPFYTQLRLDPLPSESADELLKALLGDDASLEPLKTLLIERTEGNPFFLEESVRTLVETQVLVGKPGAYRLGQNLPTIQVPPTVQAVLAARMDRLPQAEKQLLQTASVIGHEVPFTLLQAITEISDESLHFGLTHLQTAEFLYETSLFPERSYTFKHALTHEVAYGSLLQERRRVLHARIVKALEVLGGDQLTEQVERLAHHAMRGEVWDKALTYFHQVGAKVGAHAAYREAVTCFERALEALQHLPQERHLLAQTIDLHLELRHALVALGDFEHGFDHLRAAESLAEMLDDHQRLGRVYAHMTHYFGRMGNYPHALEYGQRASALTAASGNVVDQAYMHTYLGQLYHTLGDYRRALDCIRQSIASLQGEFLYARRILFGSVWSRIWLVRCLAELGAFPDALIHSQEAVQIAEAGDNLVSVVYAQYELGSLSTGQGDLSRALPLLEHALASCRTADLRVWLPGITSCLGLAYAQCGRLTDALPLLDEAAELLRSSRRGDTLMMTTRLIEAYLLGGRLEDASQLAERDVKVSRERQEQGWQAHVLRLLGDIAMHRNPAEIEQAETHYHRALTLATELGMRPLQAHCHRGLGTLYAKTGQAEQARTELSTAIEMYRDMEMTFWLPETEAALAQGGGR